MEGVQIRKKKAGGLDSGRIRRGLGWDKVVRVYFILCGEGDKQREGESNERRTQKK